MLKGRCLILIVWLVKLRHSLVNEFLQFLASLELGDAFGRNTNGVACFGVTAAARATLAHAKAAEAPQLNLLALVQTFDYAFENDFDQSLSIFLGQLGGVGHIIDKIGFSHAVTSLKKAVAFRPGEPICKNTRSKDKRKRGGEISRTTSPRQSQKGCTA